MPAHPLIGRALRWAAAATVACGVAVAVPASSTPSALPALAEAAVRADTAPGVYAPQQGEKQTVGTASASSRRSLWVWHQPNSHQLVSFAVAHHVSRLYVNVPSRPAADYRTWVRGLHAQARARSIALYALGSDPAWLQDPRAGVAWQRDALALGVFTGTHLDVEPHGVRGWDHPTAQRALVRQHLALMTAMNKASTRPVEVDLPFWAGQVPAPGADRTWADGVLARVDAVTAMSYRDTTTGILAVGGDLLVRGAAHRKPVELAVETDKLSDCSYCTFYEEGARRLETSLLELPGRARPFPAFAGVAVHRYSGWAALR